LAGFQVCVLTFCEIQQTKTKREKKNKKTHKMREKKMNKKSTYNLTKVESKDATWFHFNNNQCFGTSCKGCKDCAEIQLIFRTL
jgi:hypothetical protein